MGVTPHDPAESPIPTYALEVYRGLASNSSESDEGTYRIFSGSISEVYSSLKISKQHYTKIMSSLIESGAIEYMRRGNVHGPTVLHLFGEPTLDRLAESATLNKAASKRQRSDLEGRLLIVESSIAGLNVKQALLNIERRLTELEAKS